MTVGGRFHRHQMPQDRKDSSAADTTKHTLAELLPGPDPTPPPTTPNNSKTSNNGNNSNNSNNGGGSSRNFLGQNVFDEMPGRPSPGMHMHKMGPQVPAMQPSHSHGPGKVYPPNQPMVFNPSNPNAPPIYPCGVCHKEVHENEQAILCESGCNFWFHRLCTGLTEDAFTMLKSEVYAEWVCDRCLHTKNIPLLKVKP